MLKLVGVILALVAVAAPLAPEAQQKAPRIGVLLLQGSAGTTDDDFRRGLRELGYVEGQSISIEYRRAQGRLDRLRELAADLVRLKVDVIVMGGVAATRAAQQAITIIPIVMLAATDPLGAGLISSLARPGATSPARPCSLSWRPSASSFSRKPSPRLPEWRPSTI
jgi:ABC-type uncharacterized transport system substrate-binding protein